MRNLRVIRHSLAPIGRSISMKLLAAFYHKNVLKHFKNPKNVGSFNPNDKHVGTGKFPHRILDKYISNSRSTCLWRCNETVN